MSKSELKRKVTLSPEFAYDQIQRLEREVEGLRNAAEQARSWMTMPKGVEGERNTVASVGRRQKQIIAVLTEALSAHPTEGGQP